MTHPKENCEKLYEEYKKLSEKIRIAAHTYPKDNKSEIPALDPNDVLRKEEIRRGLIDNCKKYLNLKDEEWFEIENG